MVTGSVYDFVMDQNCHMRFIIILICQYIIIIRYKHVDQAYHKGEKNAKQL